MKKWITPIAICAVLSGAIAQETQNQTEPTSAEKKISFSARGTDVRYVLFDIFSQVKKNFLVQETGIVNLFVSVQEIGFDQAIDVVCKAGNIEYKVVDGVYVFSKAKKTANPTNVQSQTTVQNQSAVVEKPIAKKLDEAILNKHLTIRLQQTEIRKVFGDIGKQIGITIEIAPAVKNFKVNAFLIDTSLRFALNSLTQSAGLVYSLTDHGTVLVTPIEPAAQTVAPNPPAKLTCSDCKVELAKGWKYCPMCGNYVERQTKG